VPEQQLPSVLAFTITRSWAIDFMIMVAAGPSFENIL